MLRQLMFGAIVCMSSVSMADALGDVGSAIQKLNDASNYSWKQTSENAGGGGFGAGTQEGKTEKDGYTTLNLTFGDNNVQVVMKGKKGVVKTDDGWKTGEEMADEQGPGRFMAMMVQNFKTPGQMLADNSGKIEEFKQADGAYVAEVSGKDANDLLMGGFGGRRGRGGNAQPPDISNAKVVVKLWVKDGVISKSEIHATGTISFNGNDRDIDRTTTTEFSDVGSTKIEVPEDAKKKLG